MLIQIIYYSRYSDGRSSGLPGLEYRQGKYFCLLHNIQPVLMPIQPPIQWVLCASSPGVKRPGREADHSPPSSAEVKKGGGISPLPPHVFMVYCLIN
jgi:hypothetical protein